MTLLEARTVSYQYPGSTRGVTPFSLSAARGDFISIEGPSGSGKSTIARCLSGLIPHLYHGTMQGEVKVGGHLTHTQPLWQLAEHCGMVFQNPASQMLGLSVEEEIIFGLENLGLDAEQIEERLNDTVERFQLEALRNRSPQTLSGGEQQKVALAAIMARQPDVLVLDEPLSMLDVTAASALVNDLEALTQQGTGVVIFEHRAEYLSAVADMKTIQLNRHRQNTTTLPVLPEQLPFNNQPIDGALEIQHLTVHLGGKRVLSDFNLSVEGGQTVAVVGRNGSGKTTLLRALAGLQKYDGDIYVAGDRPQFGLVFQNADLQLFNATVQDEVLYKIPTPDMHLFHNIMTALGLTEYLKTPPLLLSEGEKKRVALATVLMQQPRHGILLDEPSLGQDHAHKQMLVNLAKMLNQAGLLVMMTTHDLPLAAQADQIILIGDGKIIEKGSWAELATRPAAWEQAGLHIPAWMDTTTKAAVC